MSAVPAMVRQDAAKVLLQRQIARAGLSAFYQEIFPDNQIAEHHKIIFEAVDAALRGDLPPYLVISAPPRHGKSEIISRALPAYFLGNHPGKEVVWATYNKELAADFGREVREIIKSPAYQNIFPGVQLRKDSAAANRFHSTTGGAYYAVGVEQTLTGRGGDLLIVDDPFKDWKEARSPAIRESKWKWYTSVFLTRSKMKVEEGKEPRPPVKIIMATRWHQKDLIGRIKEQAKKGGEKCHVIELPAILNVDSKRECALWPDYFPLNWLKAMHITMGDWVFSALYQQQPGANEGNIILRKDLEKARYHSPPPLEDMKIYMTLDPAVTDEDDVEEEADPDYTEFAVWGQDRNHHVWGLDWWYGKVDILEWIEQLFVMYGNWHAIVILSEKGVIRRATEPIIRKLGQKKSAPLPMNYIVADRSKALRMVPFQAMTQAGMIHLPHNAWGDRLVSHLVEFPTGPHDDAADNCSLIGLHCHKMFGPGEPPKPKKKPRTLDSSMVVKDLMPPRKRKESDY